MSTRNNETNRQEASTCIVSGFDLLNVEMAGQVGQSLFSTVSVDSVDRRLR